MTELRTILLKNGMTRKWAANVKDRFDPLTEEHVLINRYRIPRGSETEGSIPSRIPFVNMIGTGLDMGYMKPQLLEHKLNQTVLIPGTPPGRPGPQIGQLLQRNRIQGAERHQQYSGDPH